MRKIAALLCVLLLPLAASRADVHPWEKQEVTLTASGSYANAYCDVIVWIDLKGPGFEKRVYGFWDGGSTFRVRFVATAPGTWSWTSGSTPADPGLDGKSGSITVRDWTDAEKTANPLRHGFIRATANKHALEHADGTPFLAIGDTWYAVGTNRFRWYDDDKERPLGPAAGFKDYVRYRTAQGYNWVNIIAAFPNWMTDDKPWHLLMNDSAHTTVRSAWVDFESGSAKNMDNEGGRPFFFPGKVPGYEKNFPDMDRINPAYFQYIDRKIDYLNAHGIVPFIEVSRRDAGLCWYKYYQWPDSYTRFIQYIFARYQANNTVMSPVHLDIIDETVSPADYTAAFDLEQKKFGPLPFGQLLSANANPSTLENWGDSSWVTLHQIGNMREHVNYWYLTEIFNLKNPTPALNGEPYYAGFRDDRGAGAVNYRLGAKGGSERDDAFCRSCLYGSFLSGGLGGHVYGAEGIWGSDIEPSAPTHMWDAFQWTSGAQMQHLRTFAFSIGKRYQDLVPLPDLLMPFRTRESLAYEGWAYCARTDDKTTFLAYFEMGCPQSSLRGARLNSRYHAWWFDPRNGTWTDAGPLTSSRIGVIELPALPDQRDWGLRVELEAKAAR